MAAAFTTGVLCVHIHRQSFYFSDKKMGFYNPLLALPLESIHLGKNELDSIVAHMS